MLMLAATATAVAEGQYTSLATLPVSVFGFVRLYKWWRGRCGPNNF